MRAWVIGLVMLSSVMSTAEASIGSWVSNGWTYLFEPANAVVQLGKDVVTCTSVSLVRFVSTVVSNANRNPVTLSPIFQVE